MSVTSDCGTAGSGGGASKSTSGAPKLSNHAADAQKAAVAASTIAAAPNARRHDPSPTIAMAPHTMLAAAAKKVSVRGRTSLTDTSLLLLIMTLCTQP